MTKEEIDDRALLAEDVVTREYSRQFADGTYQHPSKRNRALQFDTIAGGKYLEVKERDEKFRGKIKKEGFYIDLSKMVFLKGLAGAALVLCLLGKDVYAFEARDGYKTGKIVRQKSQFEPDQKKDSEVVYLPMDQACLKFRVDIPPKSWKQGD